MLLKFSTEYVLFSDITEEKSQSLYMELSTDDGAEIVFKELPDLNLHEYSEKNTISDCD